MNINGALFILVTNATFQNVYAVVNVRYCCSFLIKRLFIYDYFTFYLQVFAMEQPMFLRDHFNGMYRTDVYVICKMLADLPFQLFFSFLFIALPYYPIGFHPDVDRFFTCVAILVMVSTVAASFGKKMKNVIIRFFFY